jgi:hypothetical protein
MTSDKKIINLIYFLFLVSLEDMSSSLSLTLALGQIIPVRYIESALV